MTSPTTSSTTSPAAARHVAVRMYRKLLGDCFLLRFPGVARDVHMLIDCGVLQGMPEARENMEAIAKDLAATLPPFSPQEGRAEQPWLDVMVVTHEHWDHLSGIAQAREIWDGIGIGELWLGWTEDPNDAQARALRQNRKTSLRLLERIAALTGATPGMEERSQSLGDLFDFTGPMEIAGDAAGLAAAAEKAEKGIRTGADVLDYLRAKAKRARYWTPGVEPFAVPGTTGTKVYVLGPPRDETLLRRSAPRKTDKEVYELSGADDLHVQCLLGAMEAQDGKRSGVTMPFAERYVVGADMIDDPSKAWDQEIPHSRRIDDATRASLKDRYYGEADKWRRIDADWLGSAEQLALKLDNDTNNTSLVLALDVAPDDPDGKVLLFPGDAQVGSWLSWGSSVWPAGAGREDAKTTVDTLLARTVLYKVGHHCSHNATLRGQGLELMTHRDLVALIPVVENFARGKARPWNMPFPALLTRLKERTRGRILRGDRTHDQLAGQRQDTGAAPPLSETEWNGFMDRVSTSPGGDIYIEYRIPL